MKDLSFILVVLGVKSGRLAVEFEDLWAENNEDAREKLTLSCELDLLISECDEARSFDMGL